jgi:hypothetical protein
MFQARNILPGINVVATDGTDGTKITSKHSVVLTKNLPPGIELVRLESEETFSTIISETVVPDIDIDSDFDVPDDDIQSSVSVSPKEQPVTTNMRKPVKISFVSYKNTSEHVSEPKKKRKTIESVKPKTTLINTVKNTSKPGLEHQNENVTSNEESTKPSSEPKKKRTKTEVKPKKNITDVSNNILCNMCDKTFKTKTTLNWHKIFIHKVTDKSLLNECEMCQTCGKTFSKRCYLSKHMQVEHPDEHQVSKLECNCDNCNLECSNSEELNIHLEQCLSNLKNLNDTQEIHTHQKHMLIFFKTHQKTC